MELDKETTKLFWSCFSGVLLLKCKEQKHCNKKCKYNNLCKLTIALAEM